ncbi:ParA family protein [Methylobacterium oxalidis]|uniref:Chromosome partitioning protein ParA n=1 Tax=Methylobacterium oxalidis TaxID=944322 RepID=A0A512IXC3_9HYPH|nr:ParA family protein [Methylobacterium oxalidis]GEP02345.1 hypothetical protein MOX02_03830 [Methylobacterium oxalidis]GJE31148.1 hypothetical protein LDDCCGHA_1324 [Methylobacterium oxalidis]GLS67724.1 hypothetical protein GCM10007888_61090 [Methylobacterium oxalidis]
MRVVTMAARKGGAGKSTLSILLAALFARANLKTVLIDADAGQHTACAWSGQRDLGWPLVVAAANPDELALLIGHARERELDFCLIDTPAGQTPVTDAALAASDIVIVPTKCDVTDRWALHATVDDIVALEKPYLVVPTEVPAKRLGMEALDLRRLRRDMADLGDTLWEGQITDRRAISYDLAQGRVPSETDWSGLTNTECRALWRRIMEMLQRPRMPS